MMGGWVWVGVWGGMWVFWVECGVWGGMWVFGWNVDMISMRVLYMINMCEK